MEKTNDKKVLLSLRNVEVKFNVRGRILTAIRNVSLDVYENESLAIVGESGSGKSVLTKTFAGMLENNGFISNGTIILSDDEISETDVVVTPSKRRKLSMYQKMLNRYSVLERGAKEKNEIIEKKNAIKAACTVNEEEAAEYSVKIKKLTDTIVDRNNYMQTLDSKNPEDAAEIAKLKALIESLTAERKTVQDAEANLEKKHKAEYMSDSARVAADKEEIKRLEALRKTDAVDKPGFGSTALAHMLASMDKAEGLSSVTLVGLCTDICVISNAMLIKAALPEVPVIVDAACCAGVTPASHKNALEAMKMCQIDIINE